MFVDQQPQMYFALNSDEAGSVLNAITAMAKTAKVWDIPTVVTTLDSDNFTGYLPYQLEEVFPEVVAPDRTTLNAWEDERVVNAIKETGRTKIVLSGLWTEICVALPVLSALDQGYEVYVVADACGGFSKPIHDNALTRMEQAGMVPVNWISVLCELQRDWARDTYDDVMAIIKEHAGAYGIGVQYAQNLPKAAAKKAAE